MEIWIIWLIVIVALLIVELLTQMMWALCLAIGCTAGVLLSVCGASFYWQIIIVAIVALLAYVVLIPVFQKWHALAVDRKGKNSRTGMDALLGRKAILTEEIAAGRTGRARIDGDNWQVRYTGCKDSIPRGTEVVVTGYDSIILDVEPCSTPNK